jgi:hypothetical protein
LNGTTERERFANAKRSAKHRGLRFLLTFEQFQEIRRQPCYYGGGAAPDIRVGIDRRDNSVGYTPLNCVPCCNRHNEMKRDYFTHKEMLQLVATIKSAALCGNNTAGRKKLSREPIAKAAAAA